MPRTRNPYPAEFREQVVALVRTGRSVESLAREYKPCAATIHEWVRQATATAIGNDFNLRHEHVLKAILKPPWSGQGVRSKWGPVQ